MTQLAIFHNDGHGDGLVEIKCHKHGWHNVPANRWHFNGSLEKPTLSPSVREFEYDPAQHEQHKTRCHFTITDGKIEYHGDNDHEFKGQKLDLLSFSEAEIARNDWVTRQGEAKQ